MPHCLIFKLSILFIEEYNISRLKSAIRFHEVGTASMVYLECKPELGLEIAQTARQLLRYHSPLILRVDGCLHVYSFSNIYL